MSSLVLLTYAGVLLAFSVEITDELHAANPSLPPGARAVVVPLGDAGAVPTAAANASEPALLMRGHTNGSLPNSATDLRAGRALMHVPAGANGTTEVGNATVDLAALSGGAEGWILQGEAESEPFFAAQGDVLGVIARVETPGRIVGLFALGGAGFLLPLVIVIVTHRATRGQRKGAPLMVCRECRAPMPTGAEFCMRCGAWTKAEANA